tara:strand:- start:119 stop:580 length:462 start_codon:yes stop_codon:yes gene_type:complete
MGIRTIIEDKYKEAIKSKNTDEINTLRLIKSAIKDKDIASRSNNNNQEIKDEEILSLLQTLIKQRKDSIESFKSASRDDLIVIEQTEINIISSFLPKQLNQDEIEFLISKIIKDNNLNSLKDMGKLMGELRANHSGNIDMGSAGKIAKLKLSE